MPDDLDPTGVRALLANLPDPGPMPDDLVARIGQSLALEQQRRSGAGSESAKTPGVSAGSSGHPFSVLSGGASERSAAAHASASSEAAPDSASHQQGVISLDAERQRRRPGRTLLWLGGAAAVAMVATVGANQLLGDGSDSNLSAAVPGAQDSADEGADAGGVPASADADAPAGAESEARDEAAGGDSSGGDNAGGEASGGNSAASVDGDADSVLALVQPVSGTVTLTDTDLGSQVSDWVASAPAAGSTTWTTSQAADCIGDQGLDVSSADEVLVAEARWEQEPVMLLVASHESGGSAWLLSSDCGEVLSGPVSFD